MTENKKLIGLSTTPIKDTKSEVLKKIERDLLSLVYKEGTK